MSYRADKISTKLLFVAFNYFSAVSGLQVNMEKIFLYIGEVTSEFKNQMLRELQLALGELPFKYLGVPLSTRKLTVP